MKQGQLEARKRMFLKKWYNGDIESTYEVRMKRLKDPTLYTDTRVRVQ